ncbi:metal-dependent transcriptional regulator [Methanococcoides alaskense]|uniref:DtxR family Mn-dependent transcriptional regulator n=1 Tax=Methanococcoides alaskense TaxID=325778 RepID=A0AA90Z6V5_9EURY|nr:metal-dependent transcriptional regulator [Methanococcoides alaskense]MDA0524961.1 metal-dependent transcriptional regulator [Methanococcoides alaskense]MDR6222124.1 DtxR family Mn-dependent transcriptional regulator [Methanococcoides alaskense]
MKISEAAEEVLERMWICTNENNMVHVGLRSLGLNETSPQIQELLEIGNITISDTNASLTEEGAKNGRLVVRRHRLAERLLVDVLNTKDKYVHSSACEFEHILHRGIDDNVCTLLGHPSTCPHGKPIPEGECCKKARDELEQVVTPLSLLKKGQKGKIAYFNMKEEEKMQKMLAMGVLPGIPVNLVQSYPSYVFDLNHTRYAVDREIAESIFVRIE